MNNIPIDEFLWILIREEAKQEIAREISNAKVLFDTALEKLEKIGINLELIVQTDKSLNKNKRSPNHLSLSYTEAIRLLIIADFIRNNDNNKPTLIDLANYKSDTPSRDDAANEGRIINLLEAKELINKDRTAGSKMNKEKLFLNESGLKMANAIIDDAKYLRKVYNRSRNNRLREFVLKFIDDVQQNKQIYFT